MTTTALLDGLWQGAFVTAIAAVVTALVPQRHAATRYAVWFAALLALAIVPFAALWHAAPAFGPLPAPVERTAAVTSVATAKAASASGTWLVLLWLAGVALFLARLGLSYLRIHRIVRAATPAPQFGAGVLLSHDLSVPIAAGFFSPVVVVPAGLAESLDRADLDAILRHERAHIRRMDVAGNLVQRLIEACLFFNPWVYVIGRQLVKEREAACDDWAVVASNEPDRYASCLTRLAQGAGRPKLPLLTPSAIGSRRMLVGRIARLLNGKATQLKTNYLTLGASVAAFALLAVLLQTSNGMAATGDAVATTSTSASTLPANCYHDVKVLDPTEPDIAKADYVPNVSANALVTISPEGKPLSAKIVQSSGHAGIDQATIKAAMTSTYSPEVKDCKAVLGTYLFHVETGK